MKKLKASGIITGRYKCLSPEHMCVGVKYSFSLNPELQPKDYKPIDKEIEWQRDLYKKIASLRYCSSELNMEISKGGRVHFHGYITIKDVIEFFYKDIPCLMCIGSYEIDTISDPIKWDQYINKLKNLMVIWCKKYNLEYNYNDMSKHEYQFPIMISTKEIPIEYKFGIWDDE